MGDRVPQQGARPSTDGAPVDTALCDDGAVTRQSDADARGTAP